MSDFEIHIDVSDGKFRVGVLTKDNNLIPLKLMNDRLVEFPASLAEEFVGAVIENSEELEELAGEENAFEYTVQGGVRDPNADEEVSEEPENTGQMSVENRP